MKKVLLKLALAIVIIATTVSCKKENPSTTSVENGKENEMEIVFSHDDNDGSRADELTVARQLSLSIISSISSGSMYFDTDDLYALGNFEGGYIFCVPSCFENYYLVIFPSNSISCAFMINTVIPLTNSTIYTNIPPVFYSYEIYDANVSDLLFYGRIYPRSSDMQFTVTNVFVTDFDEYEYNLTGMFADLAIGTYTYQGAIQGANTFLTLDQYLFSIAKECYRHFNN